MKYKLIIFFLLFSLKIFSNENLYEDALYHMILEEVEGLETGRTENHHDSIFYHEVVLVKNDIVDNYIHKDSVANYKIKIIDNVKNYIDTVTKTCVVFYEIYAMDFDSRWEAPFHIDFHEYFLVKKNNKLVHVSDSHEAMCYKYVEHKKRKKIKYSYWNSAGGTGMYTLGKLRKKGWIDY